MQKQPASALYPSSDGMSAEDMWDYLANLCLMFVFPEDHECGLAATLSRSKNRSWTASQPFSRVCVYAKYGPGVPVEDGHATFDHTTNTTRVLSQVRLKSGGQGKLLQAHELKQLLDEEQRSFLCEMYPGGDGATAPIAGTGFRAASSKNNSHKVFSADVLAKEGTMSTTSLTRMDPSRSAGDANASSVLSLRRGCSGPAPRRTVPEAARNMIAPNTGAAALDSAVYGEVMSHRDPLCYAANQISKDELRSVLANGWFPTREKDGRPSLRWSTIADAMSSCLLQERQRRINGLMSSTPSLGVIRQDPRVTNRAAVYFYSRTHPKPRVIRRFDNPQDVLVALHRYAYQVSDVTLPQGAEAGRGKPTASQLNNNIKCLRADYVADKERPGWNGMSCLAGSHGPGGSKLVQRRMAAPTVDH